MASSTLLSNRYELGPHCVQTLWSPSLLVPQPRKPGPGHTSSLLMHIFGQVFCSRWIQAQALGPPLPSFQHTENWDTFEGDCNLPGASRLSRGPAALVQQSKYRELKHIPFGAKTSIVQLPGVPGGTDTLLEVVILKNREVPSPPKAWSRLQVLIWGK